MPCRVYEQTQRSLQMDTYWVLLFISVDSIYEKMLYSVSELFAGVYTSIKSTKMKSIP